MGILLAALLILLILSAVLLASERHLNTDVDRLTAAQSQQLVQTSRLSAIEIEFFSQPGSPVSPSATLEAVSAITTSRRGLAQRREQADDAEEIRLLDAALAAFDDSIVSSVPDASVEGSDRSESVTAGSVAARRVNDWILFTTGALAAQRADLADRRWQLGLVVALALVVSVLTGALMWVMLRNTMHRSIADLERMAATDSLTGLKNQRAFHERLEEEVARSERSGAQLSLVLMDIDHFKAVNDNHGHQTGDRVLAEIGRALAQASRRGELVARIGGEEFAWLATDADSWGALAIGERARTAIGALDMPPVGRVTASAGVAEHEPGDDADTLVRNADRALYLAKANGRDASFRFGPGAAEIFEGALSPEDFATPS